MSAKIRGKKNSVADLLRALGEQARAAERVLAHATTAQKNLALTKASANILDSWQAILAANARDMEAARAKGLSPALLDRLALDEARVKAIAASIDAIRDLPDPIGQVMAEWTRPNGLVIRRVRVPLGVIGIIYESRPNVTADASALCLKSGNAVILRGGSESYHSSTAIHACMAEGLKAAGLPEGAVQMVSTTSREAVGILLSDMREFIDVIIPRGGKGLIARVQADARVPVIGHLEGLCHVYVHGSADPAMARDVVLNAKMRRTGICGAAETLLIDKACLDTHWAGIADALFEAGCELRGDEEICRKDSRVRPALDSDWDTEYLDAILAVKTVHDVGAAIAHINRHGSGHTESIIANNEDVVARFQNELDSAIILHNASTQYADGGEFGMGAEIGIATGRIHARGPVGAEQLTSYKYLVEGTGQTRP